MVAHRTPATYALFVVLVLQACAGVAVGVVAFLEGTAGGSTFGAPNPTIVGVLSIAATLLGGLVLLALIAAGGLWRGRPWAGTLTGLFEAILLTLAVVGAVSVGWRAAFGLVGGSALLAILLLAGRSRESSRQA